MVSAKYRNILYWAGSALFLIIATLILYHSYLSVGYFTNDYVWFGNLENLLSPFNGIRWLPALFFTNYLAVKIFHLDPFWPKTIVLIFSLANLILAQILLVRITGNKILSFISVAIFVFFYHSYTNIMLYEVGQIYAIFPALFLTSLLTYFAYLKRPRIYLYITTIILYPLMLFFIEAMIILPFVLLAMDYFFEKNFDFARSFKRLAPFFMLMAAYLIFTAFTTNDPMTHSSVFERGGYWIVPFSKCLENFVKLWTNFFPTTYIPSLSTSSYFIICILILTLTLVILFVRQVPRYLKFLLVVAWLTMIPFVPINNGVSHRYLYLSGLFLMPFLVFGIYGLLKKNVITKIMFAGLIGLFIYYNLRLLAPNLRECEQSAKALKNFNRELDLKFPDALPSPTLLVYEDPTTMSKDYLYFYYHRSLPKFIYIAPTKKEAIATYQRCLPIQYSKLTPLALIFDGTTLSHFEITSLDKNDLFLYSASECPQSVESN